jgi:hypothetical protein
MGIFFEVFELNDLRSRNKCGMTITNRFRVKRGKLVQIKKAPFLRKGKVDYKSAVADCKTERWKMSRCCKKVLMNIQVNRLADPAINAG